MFWLYFITVLCTPFILVGCYFETNGDVDLFLMRYASSSAIVNRAQDRILVKRGCSLIDQSQYQDACVVFNQIIHSRDLDMQGVGFAFLCRMYFEGRTRNDGVRVHDLQQAYCYALRALECPLPDPMRSYSLSVLHLLFPDMIDVPINLFPEFNNG